VTADSAPAAAESAVIDAVVSPVGTVPGDVLPALAQLLIDLAGTESAQSGP
jgi:hypothetical protein